MSVDASADLISLDLHGAVCPEPLMRVTEAIKRAGPGQGVQAEIDFPPAVLTLASIVQRQPWDLTINGIGPGAWRLTFTPRPEVDSK